MIQLKPHYVLGHLYLGELYLNTMKKRNGCQKPEKGRGDVPGDGNGLLAGQDPR